MSDTPVTPPASGQRRAIWQDAEKVGDCWHCGGYVAAGSEPDDYVFIGSLVYHRGCAERLRDELDAVL